MSEPIKISDKDLKQFDYKKRYKVGTRGVTSDGVPCFYVKKVKVPNE